jgi:hypothetical protein
MAKVDLGYVNAAGERVLPMTTTVRPDGVVERRADPRAVAALTAAAASAGCGNFCDGQDPQNYAAHLLDGSWAICADDAFSVYAGTFPDHPGPTVQLRYSPRCRTAWAKGPYYFYLEVHSYDGSSLRRMEYAGRWRDAPGDATHYTRMVNDKYLVAEACMYEDGWRAACTSKW